MVFSGIAIFVVFHIPQDQGILTLTLFHPRQDLARGRLHDDRLEAFLHVLIRVQQGIDEIVNLGTRTETEDIGAHSSPRTTDGVTLQAVEIESRRKRASPRLAFPCSFRH